MDIDDDGDFDAFIGEFDGNINYYLNASLLPVELISFKGKATAEGTLLQWQTASEEKNKGFQIQRSADGRNWENIGFVNGNGTTHAIQHYAYTDKTPLSGSNYYRLKQVDFDGRFEYSDVVSVEFDFKKDDVSVFPNPVKDEMIIIHGEGTGIIYNALGQSMMEFVINGEQFSVQTNDLPNGQYLLQVIRRDGVVITHQFLK